MKKLSHGMHCALGRTRNPKASAKRKERDRERYLENKETWAAMRASGMGYVSAKAPPDHVIEEARIAIASGPRDITAAAFGDPLPGRSALDKRS